MARAPSARPLIVGRNPGLTANAARRLSVSSRRDFAANQLNVDPRRIGISRATTIIPGNGHLVVPNKYSISLIGNVRIEPEKNKFELANNASIWVRFRPAAMRRARFYVLVATIKSTENQRFSYAVSKGRTRDSALINLRRGVQAENFLAEVMEGKDAELQLFGERTWNFEKLEITPVNID